MKPCAQNNNYSSHLGSSVRAPGTFLGTRARQWFAPNTGEQQGGLAWEPRAGQGLLLAELLL